jgi:hypothetical protein
MYPTMMSSGSPPITGEPAQDLGGAKHDPKVSCDASIYVEPNKKILEEVRFPSIYRTSAPELCLCEANEKSSELANTRTTYLPKNPENDPTSNVFDFLNSLLMQTRNPMSDFQTFTSFISNLSFEALYKFFQFYIFKKPMQVEMLKPKLLILFQDLCSLCNNHNQKFVFSIVLLIRDPRYDKFIFMIMNFIRSNAHNIHPTNAFQYLSALRNQILAKIEALKNSEVAVNLQKQSLDDENNPNHSTLEKE